MCTCIKGTRGGYTIKISEGWVAKGTNIFLEVQWVLSVYKRFDGFVQGVNWRQDEENIDDKKEVREPEGGGVIPFSFPQFNTI